MKRYFLVLIFCCFMGLGIGQNYTKTITKELAVKLAEQFIAENGYTSLPGNVLKLKYEFLDRKERNIDSLFVRRNNTLHQKAFCIFENEDRWSVGFLLTDVNLDLETIKTNLSGRVVVVMKDGSDIKMAHKEPLFSSFEKL